MAAQLLPIRLWVEPQLPNVQIFELIHVDLDVGLRFQILTLEPGSMC